MHHKKGVLRSGKVKGNYENRKGKEKNMNSAVWERVL